VNAGLSSVETELLREVVSRRSPESLSVVDVLAQRRLTHDEREELRQIVADELVEHGLRDDEPNEYGHRMERLIDALGHQ
jgi:hypothetical protein